MIATTQPGSLIRGRQERVNLGPVQKLNQSSGVSLAGDCQDTLDLLRVSWFLVGRIVKERANSGQTKISTTRSDLAAVLQVIEKRRNHWGVDVLKCETGRWLVQPPLRELKEQSECIAIGTDCVRARLALTDQALTEKALQQRRETDGPHDCPSPCFSRR